MNPKGGTHNPETVETLRQAYAALNREGIDSAFRFLDPSIEFVPVPGWLPDAEHFHGHDGVRAWFAKIGEVFDIDRWEPREYIDAGDRLVISVTITGKARATGIRGQLELYQVWTVHRRKAVRMEAFLDRAQALEAAGYSEGGNRPESRATSRLELAERARRSR
jgi:ketosteroid isomerase-like protein